MATTFTRAVRLRRLGGIVAQIICGIGIVLGIGLGIRFLLNARAMSTAPAGWRIITPPASVLTLSIVGDVVWAGGKDGVTLLDRRTGVQSPLPPGAPAFSFVRAMLLDSHGVLWIAHDDGLTSFTHGRWTTFTGDAGVSLKPALSLLEARDHSLWVGTTGGMARYAHSGWSPVALPSSMPMVAADVLYQDQSGAI
jgi:ligand-binding sensor domain-containing protein